MSLRSRLTLLYTSIVGGILLLFGVAVYVAVSLTVTHQLDDLLRRTAEQVIEKMQVDDQGGLVLTSFVMLELPADVFVQVWDRQGSLIESTSNVFGLARPLDTVGLQSSAPVFRDVILEDLRLRVLTVPLELSNRLVGTIQVGTRLNLVLATQETLLTVLLVGVLVATLVAGLAAYFSTRQAFHPLGSAIQVALQIMRADDLSRRIPYHGPPGDEVGQLITVFNQTLERLETLFHTQRRFLADVGHELRTPLTVIKGNVGLMQRMGEIDEESLCGIDDEVDRLTRLVGDLLLLAQAESGKIPMARQVVELDTLLLEVMSQMSILARGKQQLRLGSIDQVLVLGDRDRLKQVIVNLVSNAIYYTPTGSEVLVGLGKASGQAHLTVTDNGPGIPAEDLPHIFERFYRSEKSRTRQKEKGFGLGLSIAYWIVRSHGGRIEVASTVGKGTTFSVWLPLTENIHQQELVEE
ncbi:MAG: sensor histidine kinase N-terminal domain-containing protein [Anaerolineales bacterium]|nr:sensor histidine kinase N-terminal domain-containing protein [Anaerolineales bacterium]